MKEEKYLYNLIERYPVLSGCRQDIWDAFLILREAYKSGSKLLTCGNGGSAADAEHIVGELMKEFYIRRPLSEEMRDKLLALGDDGTLQNQLQGALPAITLTGNISLSTAYANDVKPELVFAQQVIGYGVSGDVLVGISTSGNSRNVIYAIITAKAKGMKIIGITGENGGELKNLCDACICVPGKVTYEIQELHLPVYHCLCMMIEEVFFG